MIDLRQSQPGRAATEDTAASPQKPSQTLMDSLLAMQALHVQLIQSLLLNWMEVIMLPWGQPYSKRRSGGCWRPRCDPAWTCCSHY